jgi:hypothetical protein
MTFEQEKRLVQAAEYDDIYQALLAECGALEPSYTRIKNSLRQEDQDILERYIALCEELEYRRTILAVHISDM